LGGVFRDVTYDAADRIVGYTHRATADGVAQPGLDQSFGYDANGQLIGVTMTASNWVLAYDANGNRTSTSLNGSTSTYITEATSNRLSSITNPARSFSYDNAGSTTGDSLNYMATYDLRGSLETLTKEGVTATYSYDAERRRVRKFTSAGSSSTVIFIYDLNGQLLGEYDNSGRVLREYVWLNDIPVAMLLPDPANATNMPLVFYIHADHLGAPRVVVDKNDVLHWRWLAEPFGTTAPEVDPSSFGVFEQNLRFPGQYADSESGLWYNYFRNYDSSKGYYIQSDPIGLGGGVNTYVYVNGRPTEDVDPFGLFDSESINKTTKLVLTPKPAQTPIPKTPAVNPILAALVLMCMPANVGPEGACSDDPRLERPECRDCQNNNHPDLYRSGNAQGPKMTLAYMRIDKEYAPNGMATPGYGASSFEAIHGSGRWWKFPAGVPVPATLCLRHTHGDHWQFEPATTTTLSEYGAAIASTIPFWIDMGNVK
jgi:RHS repeat-associated protein